MTNNPISYDPPALISIRDVLRAAECNRVAHNGGAQGQYIFVGTEAEIVAMAEMLMRHRTIHDKAPGAG